MIVEAGGADFTCFIEEVDGEKTALTTLIVPFFDFGFMYDAHSDSPSSVSYSEKGWNTCSDRAIILRWDRLLRCHCYQSCSPREYTVKVGTVGLVAEVAAAAYMDSEPVVEEQSL